MEPNEAAIQPATQEFPGILWNTLPHSEATAIGPNLEH
jgi:hypothetical protein